MSPEVGASIDGRCGVGHRSGPSQAAFRNKLQSSADRPEAGPEVIEELKKTFLDWFKLFDHPWRVALPGL